MKHFVADSYFEVVADVTHSWGLLKRQRNYAETFGVALFKRMFEIAPDAWTMFPWGKEMGNDEDCMFKGKTFLKFASNFVGMLDLAIDMLGPDMDLVEEQLQSLGVTHVGFGVMPKHYPLMEKALFDTLQQQLGDSFTARHKESWNTVYTFMSVTMLQGAFVALTTDNKSAFA